MKKIDKVCGRVGHQYTVVSSPVHDIQYLPQKYQGGMGSNGAAQNPMGVQSLNGISTYTTGYINATGTSEHVISIETKKILCSQCGDFREVLLEVDADVQAMRDLVNMKK